MEFSPAIYKRLLGFYEDKFEVSRGNELQGQRSNLSQAEILYQGWDFVKKNYLNPLRFSQTRETAKKKLSKFEKLHITNDDKIEVFSKLISNFWCQFLWWDKI